VRSQKRTALKKKRKTAELRRSGRDERQRKQVFRPLCITGQAKRNVNIVRVTLKGTGTNATRGRSVPGRNLVTDPAQRKSHQSKGAVANKEGIKIPDPAEGHYTMQKRKAELLCPAHKKLEGASPRSQATIPSPPYPNRENIRVPFKGGRSQTNVPSIRTTGTITLKGRIQSLGQDRQSFRTQKT